MIEYASLLKRHKRYQNEIRQAVNRVLDSGWFLLGDETRLFEQEYARFIGCRHAVAVGNGLDALTLIYRAYIEMGILRPGDEVIVPANTYIATILSISENGLVPVLVEPRLDTLEMDPDAIEAHITPRTRAILMVHLYGRCAYTEKIGEICRKYGLKLLEDNAQAHGCRFAARRTGSLGDAAAHSFYPGKNLGALGDAGAVTTDDEDLARIVRTLANYGSSKKYVFPYKGRNSRLDEVHAAVLSVKLKYLDEDNRKRSEGAAYYYQQLRHPLVHLPRWMEPESNVYHIFPVLCPKRDALQQYLKENGVQTLIHYPIPPHKQACYKEWNQRVYPITEQIHAEELSLPLSQVMTQEDLETVALLVNSFPG
jgi:dTDP-4-amino-4,6-dideoxygalactose transaminase